MLLVRLFPVYIITLSALSWESENQLLFGYENLKQLVRTRHTGEEGAAFCFRSSSSDNSGFVPIFKIDVTDTTGAGDAFTAGFIKKLLEHEEFDQLAGSVTALKDAVVFASACGAWTTTKKGAIAAQPNLEEATELYKSSEKWYNFW